MKLLARTLVALLLATLAAGPAAAQPRQVDALPAFETTGTYRVEYALTVFGAPVGYGAGELARGNLHLTSKSVPYDGSAPSVVEAVVYDGVYYTRENEDPQWYIEPSGTPLPQIALPDFDDAASETITLIGAADVAGVPAEQYQVWLGEPDGSVVTVDFFIGTAAPRYIQKIQVSYYAEAGDTVSTLGFVYRFHDFDAPDIAVFAPEGAIPRPAGSGAAPAAGPALIEALGLAR